MAQNYIILYCLENSIRELIVKASGGRAWTDDWWTQVVPEAVRKNAEKNKKKEQASGITPRSTEDIDFTNFGELGEIIQGKLGNIWDMLRDHPSGRKDSRTLEFPPCADRALQGSWLKTRSYV